jgi:Tol biopolymer transport system component
MPELPDPPSTQPRSPADRLDSWKEIAAFLGRGIRTVQRWEREEGLPVHRLPHEKRGSVFAYRDELSSWWERRRTTLAEGIGAPRPEAAPTSRFHSGTILAIAAAVLLAGAALATLFDARHDLPPELRSERVTTTAGVTGWPALSSDGRMLAYASDGGHDGAQLQIWVQPLPGTPIPVTQCARPCGEPAFSADGTAVAYTAWEDTGQNVYEVPVRGGQPRLLRRNAHGARWSPDGKWLAFVSFERPQPQLRIASADGATDRTPAAALLGIDFAVWAPDSTRVLVRAREQPDAEPDWWTVTPDGATRETGILKFLSTRGFAGRWHTEMAPAWVDSASLVFSDGTTLWRQRVDPSTVEARGEPEQLTRAAPMAWFAAAGGGRVAFVSSNPDFNLRSITVDPESGVAYGPLKRITRGPGVVQYASLARNGRTLAYSSSRAGNSDVLLRDLESGEERVLAASSSREAYSAITPSGQQVAYGTVVGGGRAVRPVSVVGTADGHVRALCDDCRGRPREWADERFLLLERPGSPGTSLVLLDTSSMRELPLLESREQWVSDPRVSPDGEWVAFDVRDAGWRTSVYIAKLNREHAIPESEWILVAREATHPFWSFHGGVLYFLTGPSVVRARRIAPASGKPEGEPFTVFTSTELSFPARIPGTTPVATPDQIVFVLADLRGDVWLMDLAARRLGPPSREAGALGQSGGQRAKIERSSSNK